MTTKVRREFESLASAAERTGLSIRTLRRRIASGHLAAYRSGARVIRVDPDDVEPFKQPRRRCRCPLTLPCLGSRPPMGCPIFGPATDRAARNVDER